MIAVREADETGITEPQLELRPPGLSNPTVVQRLHALREDPDVLMVGEMREPETMRLTLNASETGHLVLTTLHSATCAEALARVVNAFPAEMQNSVRAQLADCLLAVICQRLRYRADLKIRVPECEIMVNTMAVKNFIRMGDFDDGCQTVRFSGATIHDDRSRVRAEPS